MNNKDFAAKLLPSFSVLHYFFRQHNQVKENDYPVLKAEHFAYLWLADKLQKDVGRKEFERDTAGSITFWRREPIATKETTKTLLLRIVEDLKQVDFIEEVDCHNKAHKHDGRSEVLRLTDKGEQKLEKLEEERIREITEVLKLIDFEINPAEVVEEYKILSSNVWKRIKQKAIPKSKKAKEKD
jgi:DNA-binding MarR family transcriptional regulator